jgi:hypothetical protein
VSLLVYFHVFADRNFQLDYHPIAIMSGAVPRGLLLAAYYMHTILLPNHRLAFGWNKASLFDATPIFPRRPMEHDECSSNTALVVISNQERLYSLPLPVSALGRSL